MVNLDTASAATEQNKTFSTCSKTFLAGEYLALSEGQAIALCTGPRFQFSLKSYNTKTGVAFVGIHPKSPAGQFLSQQPGLLTNGLQRSLEFIDPHQGSGGFGASSAQFVFAYQLFKKPDFEILDDYHKYSFSGEGIAPSGADVIAQALGQKISFIDIPQKTIHSIDWPFADLDFAILKTGKKLPTHEHLQSLDLGSTKKLKEPHQKIWQSLLMKDEENFFHSLDEFYQLIALNKWVAPHTAEHLKFLKSHSEILFAKGCGALGADTLLIFYKKNQTKKVKTIVEQTELVWTSTSADLTHSLTSDSLTDTLAQIEKQNQEGVTP